ncbi:MAG: crossover junction endodeoxyribonuclease RuvC [Chloroflexales bacterium]|nr:crossover junction endodeoxyribonuclease RuvC [Chloroflexales bacterium]
MRTIGIDPGTAIMGWGIVDSLNGNLSLVACGTFTTPAGMPQSERLLSLYGGICECLTTYQPDNCAVEELFFSKNVTTAITVSQARGVVLLALAQAGLTVYEYKPIIIKQTVAGYGGADKRQLQEMVRLTLRMPNIITPDDAADAVAIAICHTYSLPMAQHIRQANAL